MSKENKASSLVIGHHAVSELLRQQPDAISELLIQSDRRDRRMQELRDLAKAHQIFLQEVDKATLDKTGARNHQGVVAKAISGKGPVSEQDLSALLAKCEQPPLLLVLDGVTDPHNLGACLRSADAAGVTAVIIPKDKAVGLTPVVRKVASGAAETVPLVVVTNLARALQSLQEKRIWVVGTDDQAEISLYEQDLKGPLAIVMGSEGAGLRRLTRECCDYLVSIPMAGELSSLNVSVAAGVTLFEAVRQRRSTS